MTRPRSTTSQADELGAMIASLKARLQAIELLAHTPCSGGGGGCPCPEQVLLAGDTMTGFLTLNADPTNALHASTKQYTDAQVATAVTPTGVVSSFAGVAAPSGWLICDGTAYSTTLQPNLFAVIGSAYNNASGQSSPAAGFFRVPDLRSRVAIGAGTGIGLTNRPLASSGGQETRQIASANLPTHTHSIDHDHPNTTSTTVSANHTHTFGTGGISANHTHGIGFSFFAHAGGGVITARPDGNNPLTYPTLTVSADHSHSGTTAGFSANHTHNTDLPNFVGSSGNGGFANTAIDTIDPFLTLNYIIKV